MVPNEKSQKYARRMEVHTTDCYKRFIYIYSLSILKKNQPKS